LTKVILPSLVAGLAPPLLRPEYKYAPVSKDQTQSHLYSQEVNAKSTSSSTRGLPESHSATALKIYEHRAGSPCNVCFSLPHWLYHKPAFKTSAKKTYDHPVCPSRNGRFKPTSPVISRTRAQSFCKEDLQASNVSPTQPALSATKTYDHPVCPPRNELASSSHQRFVASGPFQGQQLPVCVRVMTAENSGVSTCLEHSTSHIVRATTAEISGVSM
jgi:hypothetical protein